MNGRREVVPAKGTATPAMKPKSVERLWHEKDGLFKTFASVDLKRLTDVLISSNSADDAEHESNEQGEKLENEKLRKR